MTIFLYWLTRVIEVFFFIGVAGCLVTILLSWSAIFREEFGSKK